MLKTVHCVYPDNKTKSLQIYFYHATNKIPQFGKQYSIIACSQIWDKGYYSIPVDITTTHLFFDTLRTTNGLHGNFLYREKHDQTINQLKINELTFSFYFRKTPFINFEKTDDSFHDEFVSFTQPIVKIFIIIFFIIGLLIFFHLLVLA